jgi:hypothetical protein
MDSSTTVNFWERLWRSSGIIFAVFFVVAYVFYGLQRGARGMLWVLIAVGAALAYSIVGSGNDALTTGVNDLAWACIVVSSFPRAMLIMAGTFGLWRAKLISNALFGAGVAAGVLVLVGCTTWASEGIWAPSGDYSRFVSPIIGLVWIMVFSGVLLTQRSPSTAPRAPEPPAAPAAS